LDWNCSEYIYWQTAVDWLDGLLGQTVNCREVYEIVELLFSMARSGCCSHCCLCLITPWCFQIPAYEERDLRSDRQGSTHRRTAWQRTQPRHDVRAGAAINKRSQQGRPERFEQQPCPPTIIIVNDPVHDYRSGSSCGHPLRRKPSFCTLKSESLQVSYDAPGRAKAFWRFRCDQRKNLAAAYGT